MNGIMLTGFEGRLFDTVVAATVLFAAALVLTRVVWQPVRRIWIIQFTLIGALLLVPGLFMSLRPVSLGWLSNSPTEVDVVEQTNDFSVAATALPAAEAPTSVVGAKKSSLPPTGVVRRLSRVPSFEMSGSDLTKTETAAASDSVSSGRWLSWLVLAYAAGASGMLMWLVIGQWSVRRLVARSVEPDGELVQVWRTLQEEMQTLAARSERRRARLLISDDLHQPVAVGVLRPAVVLPRWLIESSSSDALRPVLAHELAHIARRDAALRWLAALVQIVFYYHPLFWRLRRELRLCQEYLADARAASHADSAAAFAEQLVTLLKRASGRSWRVFPAAGIVEAPSELYRRVQMLVKPARKLDTTSSVRWHITSGIALFMFGQLLCLMTLRAGDAESKSAVSTTTESVNTKSNAPPAAAPKTATAKAESADEIEEKKVQAVSVTVGDRKARQVPPPAGSPPGVLSFEYDEPGPPPKVVRMDILSDVNPPKILRMMIYDPDKPDEIYEVTPRPEDEGGDFRDPMPVQRIPAGVVGPPDVADDELAGIVVDEQGKPVEGVKVLIWTMDDEKIRTGKDGVFRYKFGPKFGDERHPLVHFVKDGYAPYLVVDWLLGQKLRVVVMETKTYFEGVVRKPDGTPAPNALIRANQGPKYANPAAVIGEIWAETRSDANGHYKLLVQPDTYILDVRAPGIGTARIPRPGEKGDPTYEANAWLGPNENAPPRMRIEPGQAKPLDIELVSGIDFRAKVVDSVTGKPVPNVRFWHWQHPGVEGRTDNDGRVTVPSLPPGEFTFMLEAPGYLRAWSKETSAAWQKMIHGSRTKVSMIEMDEGLAFDMVPGMSETTISLEPCVTVTGCVLDPDGKPVAGATVAPVRTGTGRSLTGDTRYSVQSKEDGTYVASLPPSDGKNYHLVVHDGEYQKWRKWANGHGPAWQTVPGQKIENVDLQLSRPGIIRGRTVDEKGKPLANVFIHATPVDLMENSYYIPDTRSDKEGRFELRYVRPGKHLVHGWMNVNVLEAAKLKLPTVEVKAGETIDVSDVFIPKRLREQP